MHLTRVTVVAMFPPGRPEPDVSAASPVRMLSPAEAAIQTYALRDTCGERPLRSDPAVRWIANE